MFNRERKRVWEGELFKRERELAISFFGRPALGDFPDHKARQPLKFVVANTAKSLMICVKVFKYSSGHALKGTIVVICVNSPLHITVIFLYSACSPQIQRQIIAIMNSELWCSLKAFIVERIDAVLYVLFTFHITVAVLFAPKVLCNSGKGKLFLYILSSDKFPKPHLTTGNCCCWYTTTSLSISQ